MLLQKRGQVGERTKALNNAEISSPYRWKRQQLTSTTKEVSSQFNDTDVDNLPTTSSQSLGRATLSRGLNGKPTLLFNNYTYEREGVSREFKQAHVWRCIEASHCTAKVHVRDLDVLHLTAHHLHPSNNTLELRAYQRARAMAPAEAELDVDTAVSRVVRTTRNNGAKSRFKAHTKSFHKQKTSRSQQKNQAKRLKDKRKVHRNNRTRGVF